MVICLFHFDSGAPQS